MKTLIDGDILTYRVGFAIQKDVNREWAYKYNIDQMMSNILHKTKADSYQVYLSGKTNFRYDLATIIPYKSNRDKSKRPEYYDKIRDYLQVVYNAEVTEEIEADDAMGIAQNMNTCIASIDKDLDMIPGHHYNFVKDNFYTITPEQADKNYWIQVLTGDSADAIPGLKGIGKKTAEKILEHCNTFDEMENTVHNKYHEWHAKYSGNYLKGAVSSYPAPTSAFNEIKQLLWIKRE